MGYQSRSRVRACTRRRTLRVLQLYNPSYTVLYLRKPSRTDKNRSVPTAVPDLQQSNVNSLSQTDSNQGYGIRGVISGWCPWYTDPLSINSVKPVQCPYLGRPKPTIHTVPTRTSPTHHGLQSMEYHGSDRGSGNQGRAVGEVTVSIHVRISPDGVHTRPRLLSQPQWVLSDTYPWLAVWMFHGWGPGLALTGSRITRSSRFRLRSQTRPLSRLSRIRDPGPSVHSPAAAGQCGHLSTLPDMPGCRCTPAVRLPRGTGGVQGHPPPTRGTDHPLDHPTN